MTVEEAGVVGVVATAVEAEVAMETYTMATVAIAANITTIRLQCLAMARRLLATVAIHHRLLRWEDLDKARPLLRQAGAMGVHLHPTRAEEDTEVHRHKMATAEGRRRPSSMPTTRDRNRAIIVEAVAGMITEMEAEITIAMITEAVTGTDCFGTALMDLLWIGTDDDSDLAMYDTALLRGLVMVFAGGFEGAPFCGVKWLTG